MKHHRPYHSGAKPSPGYNAEIGRVVRRIRIQNGLRLEDLAGAAGVERAQLGKLELGRKRWRTDTLREVAAVLGVTLATIFEQVEP